MPAEQPVAERVGRPYPSRTNVSQACESCRKRKARCSGDRPSCIACTKQGRECVYAEHGDKRRGDLPTTTTKSATPPLKRSASPSGASSSDASAALRSAALSSADGEDQMALTPLSAALDDPEFHGGGPEVQEPWGVAELVLSTNGNLHSNPEPTLYRPVRIALRPPIQELPAHYLPCSATYLPIPLDTAQHRLLVEIAFNHALTLGMNAWKMLFIESMMKGVRNPFFSPALHLTIIANALRYCQDMEVVGRYLLPGQEYKDRGMIFLEAAKREVEKEALAPQLSTIMAYLLMSATYVGMALDDLGWQAYATGAFMAQDFRVHLQCDEQLKTIKEPLRGMLDMCRRDVYAYCVVVSGWFSGYYSRSLLPFVDTPTQHKTRLHGECGPSPTVSHITSHAFQAHRTLSLLSLQIVRCNHGARMSARARAEQVVRLRRELDNWREKVPKCLLWPPSGREVDPIAASIVTLFALHNADIIHLLRPYAVERSAHGGFSDPPWNGIVFEDALDTCLAAATQIIEQVHYIRDKHGMVTAPCNIQDCIYVACTILVFQASGLHPVSESCVAFALASLAFCHQALIELAEVWPAAAQTAESLVMLQGQYCVNVM